MNKESLIKQLKSQLVHIPGGEYQLGNDQFSRQLLINDEIVNERFLTNISRRVTSSDFYILDFPVTNIQFEVILPKHQRSRYGESPEHPVVEVTYYEVLKFCKDTGFRLPTEDEWEIAARFENNFPLSQSSDFNEKKVNYWRSKGSINIKGEYPPNSNEIYDMCGNVYEYTSSFLSGTNSEKIGIIRGGSWGTCKYGSLVSMRAFNDPLIRNSRIGFRICIDELS